MAAYVEARFFNSNLVRDIIHGKVACMLPYDDI